MASFITDLLCGGPNYIDSGDEVEDDDAVTLSRIGTAAYNVLRTKHNRQHHILWNVTSGRVVGGVHQTPMVSTKEYADRFDLSENHSHWFPEKMAEIIGRTEYWCDVMSLGPPDGYFMECIQRAVSDVAKRAKENGRTVTMRFMFGNIVGMPVNCTVVIKKLTELLSEDEEYGQYLHIWVGAWRKGVSWNHAKIIAVDGHHLHTGGHNLWDYHYLRHDPVHDLSFELEGHCAHDGHLFANDQWAFVESIQSSCCGAMVDKMPDALPLVAKTRVTVSEYPKGCTTIFPPMYKKRMVPKRGTDGADGEGVPIITMGRYGAVLQYYRPSDDAFIAMFDEAESVIRMVLQDLGPVCVPGTKVALPGCVWPKEYLSALGRAIWLKGVDVEIILSNPNSIPGGLTPTEANYGNGWREVDVAAEIIKTIREQFPDAGDEELRRRVEENLRVCFLKKKMGGPCWGDGMTIGLHSKHFMVDDAVTYIGSQNLYICDLAEWGVVVDHPGRTAQIKSEYWDPLWEASYSPDDFDVQEVMDGLDIDRDGEKTSIFSPATGQQTPEQQQDMQVAAVTGMNKAGAGAMQSGMYFDGEITDYETDGGLDLDEAS